ncbi:ErfK/YbiS/YcfS/YnhG family protein [hydrothermal vent metagenome]|uniref:ErfK/YbiS/YcfS/YnhG family protein n=1 Tax=hydrothermal vent metagenome TaxID=652676 RepID=A0A3B1BT90_9ZZZZ
MLRFFVLFLSSLLLLTAPVQAQQVQMLASLETTASSSGHILPRKVDDVLKQLDLRLDAYPQDYEAQLLRGLINFKSGKPELALRELDDLLQQVPDFHLASLIRGDILLSRVVALRDIGKNRILSQLNSKKVARQLNALRLEVKFRLDGLRQHTENFNNIPPRLPRQILKLGESVKYAVLVEKSSHRLYVYQRQKNQPPKLVQNYYVSTGKKEGNKYTSGDLRTPEGVYFITSWIPKEKLPDKYGVGAFPLNYPNELDRRHGKTGYGIWLHGTESNYYSRPPLDSEGCMVLTNVDFNSLKKELRPGATPVVIVEKVDWLTPKRWLQERNNLLAALEGWRRDWESLDVDRYLSHYSHDFWSQGYDLKSWSQRKRRVARNKSYQKIQLSDISLLAYPETSTGKKDIVVARFQQDYQSSNYQSDVSKRLYLQRNNKNWKIMYEGR